MASNTTPSDQPAEDAGWFTPAQGDGIASLFTRPDPPADNHNGDGDGNGDTNQPQAEPAQTEPTQAEPTQQHDTTDLQPPAGPTSNSDLTTDDFTTDNGKSPTPPDTETPPAGSAPATEPTPDDEPTDTTGDTTVSPAAATNTTDRTMTPPNNTPPPDTGGLADMFGDTDDTTDDTTDDEQQTTPPQPTGGLDNMFGEPTTGDVPPTTEPADTPPSANSPGLADMFGDDTPDNQTKQPPTSTDNTPDNTPDTPWPQQPPTSQANQQQADNTPSSGGLGDMFGGDSPPEQPAPQQPTSDQQPPAADTPDSGTGEAPHHKIVRPPTPDAEMVRPDPQQQEQRRYSHHMGTIELDDRLYNLVDRVLGLTEHDSVQAKLPKIQRLTRNWEQDAEQRELFEEIIKPYMPDLHMPVSKEQYDAIVQVAYDELIGLGPMAPLWRDEEVTEIMVVAYDKIFVERDGDLFKTDATFRDVNHLQRTVRRLSEMESDRAVSPANPLVGAYLESARLQLVYDPVVLTGANITMRIAKPLLGMTELLEYNSLSQQMRDFLADAVVARANMIISGGTGSGKTTVINAVSEFIPDNERIITIEDVRELTLHHEHVTGLQTKEQANAEDAVQVDQAQLLKSTLRMRPDRILVGEIRDSSAAETMLDAAQTGHDGTVTSIHANDAEEALNDRMVVLLMRPPVRIPRDAAARMVSGAIDIVVHARKARGKRFISEISLVERDCLTDRNVIEPVQLFEGRVIENEDGTKHVVHERVGQLPEDSGLYHRMVDAGRDADRWTKDPTEDRDTDTPAGS